MPAPTFDRSDRNLRQRILDRVALGETLKAICSEADMPCSASVAYWARRDSAFKAALETAKRQGRWRRLECFDPARAEVLLDRMRAGETIRSILLDPAMPSRRTYNAWLADPEFAETVHLLKGVRLKERAARLRGRWRAFDWPTAERIYVRLWKGERLRAVLKSEKAFPSLSVFARWRREEPEFDAMIRFVVKGWRVKRGREKLRLSTALEAAILDGIVHGESLRSLARRPEMPCAGTLYAWAATRPEFAAAVAQACEDREDWYHERMVEIAMTATPGTVTETRKRMAPLSRQVTRLRKRPGWKRRRAEGAR